MSILPRKDRAEAPTRDFITTRVRNNANNSYMAVVEETKTISDKCMIAKQHVATSKSQIRNVSD